MVHRGLFAGQRTHDVSGGRGGGGYTQAGVEGLNIFPLWAVCVVFPEDWGEDTVPQKTLLLVCGII